MGAPVPRAPVMGTRRLMAFSSTDLMPERAAGSAGRAGRAQGCGGPSALGTGDISPLEPEPSCVPAGQEGEPWQPRPRGTEGLWRCPGKARADPAGTGTPRWAPPLPPLFSLCRGCRGCGGRTVSPVTQGAGDFRCHPPPSAGVLGGCWWPPQAGGRASGCPTHRCSPASSICLCLSPRVCPELRAPREQPDQLVPKGTR